MIRRYIMRSSFSINITDLLFCFQCNYCVSVMKECVGVAGNRECHRCLKGKKGCKFMVADEEEKESQKSQLPVAALKKILSLPIHSLCKRKEVDLLPGSVKRGQRPHR